MTLISREAGDKKLMSSENLFVKHKILGSGNHNNHENSGRNEGSKNYSTEIKSLIGLLARVDGVQNTSKALNVSISQVSHYKNGKTNGKPDEELRKELQAEELLRTDKLRKLVREKIEALVESIDEEKIYSADLNKASKAASNLASVYDKFGAKTVSPTLAQQFVFYGTPPREEDEYEVIEGEVVSR